MASRKPFIPASARHDKVVLTAHGPVNKRVRDIVAAGFAADDSVKRDGKQGSLDGIPDLVLGGHIGGIHMDDGGGGGPPKKDVTEKSTDKQGEKGGGGKEGKEDKEGKEAKDSDEKGKDAKDQDESGKIGSSEVEFGFVRYGRPELLQTHQFNAAVIAHGARGLAKGPMV